MSSNQIEAAREVVRKHIAECSAVSDSREVHVSPSKDFRLETMTFKPNATDDGWDVTQVEVFDDHTNEKLFAFFTNYGQTFYSWASCDGAELLIGAEDIYGGQTVIDLTNRKMSSYSPNNSDDFIWAEHYPSPDKKKLATVGCYWACPFDVKVYDFSNPLSLPLPVLKEFISEEGSSFLGWTEDSRLRVGIGKERVEEISF